MSPDLDPAQIQQVESFWRMVGRMTKKDLGHVLAECEARNRELTAEVQRLQDEAEKRWQHDLANNGCVPRPAYDDLAAEVQRLQGVDRERDSALARERESLYGREMDAVMRAEKAEREREEARGQVKRVRKMAEHDRQPPVQFMSPAVVLAALAVPDQPANAE